MADFFFIVPLTTKCASVASERSLCKRRRAQHTGNVDVYKFINENQNCVVVVFLFHPYLDLLRATGVGSCLTQSLCELHRRTTASISEISSLGQWKGQKAKMSLKNNMCVFIIIAIKALMCRYSQHAGSHRWGNQGTACEGKSSLWAFRQISTATSSPQFRLRIST